MPNHKTKLERAWIGNENRPRTEPRVLLEAAEKPYHAKSRGAFGSEMVSIRS